MNERLTRVIQLPERSRQDIAGFQDRFTAASLDKPADEAMTFLAVSAGSADRLGFITLHASVDEITLDPAAYIALFAVRASAEGTGVAQKLLAAGEGWARARGVARLSLDVMTSNARGRSFYEKAGFHTESLRLTKNI